MAQSDSSRAEQVAREDLVMFINACFACTGQREFYSAQGEGVSIDFLHDYILGNYRLLYARTLAAGINHFNQAQIGVKLLATGRQAPPAHRLEEGRLIAATLDALPAQRAWRMIEQLRRQRVNNRRARAIIRRFLERRRDLSFEAVKYRSRVRAAAVHAHLKLPGEVGPFLFEHRRQRAYRTELFEQFRQGRYNAEAIYSLPFTVAEGLAAKHGIPYPVFLARIAPKMTAAERLRYQRTAERHEDVELEVDLSRYPLTRLALYVLSVPVEKRLEQRDSLETALVLAARRALRVAPLRLGRVAAVLDSSYSSSGSTERRRRPLGVALGAHYLLKEASREYRAYWTPSREDPLAVVPGGQTDLVTPVLGALEWRPDLLVIVSDGHENDPPRGAAEVLRVYRARLDPERRTSIVHCNPVFDAETFSVRGLTPAIPTVGLRDAEDLPTMLGFARFAEGSVPLAELEQYLASRVAQLLEEAP